jgi:redox-sensitive bicupin YhaK (pirin superfamily)
MLSRRKLLAGALPLVVACRRDDTTHPALAQTQREPREREVERIVAAQRTMDGAGVKLNRAIGGRALGMFDPFLLLDEFQTDDPNDYIAGFPSHPHRGFETVTYMIDGAMEHKDSVGNHGRLGPGSAQWMTAGHGIVHSEMPKQERGLMWGFQLWVNLPAARKMIPPRYQDIAPARIPEVERDGAHVRVVAGSALGAVGPVTGIDVDPTFLDVALVAGAELRHPLPPGHAAFAYVTDGSVRIGAARREVQRGQVAVLGEGDVFAASGERGGGRVLLFAGRPLREPVARYGPFVMNTDEEIRRAIEDYRTGHLVSG